MAQYDDKTIIINKILDNGGDASNKDKDNMPIVNEVEVDYYWTSVKLLASSPSWKQKGDTKWLCAL